MTTTIIIIAVVVLIQEIGILWQTAIIEKLEHENKRLRKKIKKCKKIMNKKQRY